MKTAIALFLLICFAGVPQADVLYPDALTFGPSYVMGPPAGTPWTGGPDVLGAPLLMLGIVSAVGTPFSDLVPASTHELSCVLEGATCSGFENWDGMPCTGGTGFTFGNGVLSIYLDSSPDADFANVNSFRDGELVLQADAGPLHLTDDDPYEVCPMVEDRIDVQMALAFNGGSWVYRIAQDGEGKGELPGHYPDLVPEALRNLGYVLRIDGSISVSGPVATEPTTWGRVKALYR